eukprot:8950291-Lingulodinium_polyedra.AAC.1
MAASTPRSSSTRPPSVFRMQMRERPLPRNRCLPDTRALAGRSLSAPGPQSLLGSRVLRASAANA